MRKEKVMSVLINGVAKKSIADKKGIRAGDVLISVNGHEINDVLDYSFYVKEEKIVLALVSESRAKKWRIFVWKIPHFNGPGVY